MTATIFPGLSRNVDFQAGEALDFAEEERLVVPAVDHALGDQSDGRVIGKLHGRKFDRRGVVVRNRPGNLLGRVLAFRHCLHHHSLLRKRNRSHRDPQSCRPSGRPSPVVARRIAPVSDITHDDAPFVEHRSVARNGRPCPFQPYQRLVRLSRMLQDLRCAAVSSLRTRQFAAPAIATLALGIGMTAAIFSVVDAVLFRPGPLFPSPTDW